MNKLNSDEEGKGCCAPGDAAAPCCQPTGGNLSSCCSSGEGSSKKGKALISAVIIIAAIGVGAHSFMKGTSAQSQNTSPGKSFSAVLTMVPTVVAENSYQGPLQAKPQGILINVALDSLQDLDNLAADKDVVFLMLPSDAQIPTVAIPKQVAAVANNLMNSRQQVGVFTLKSSTPDHDKLVRHFSVNTFPSVIILGRQGSACVVSGDITEARLYSAFVLASKPVSCCPSQGNAACCATQNNAACCPK